jgi:hypothetical protein
MVISVTVRVTTLKIEAIRMQIVKALIVRLKCALAGRVLARISSSRSSRPLVSSGRSLLARKGVLSELCTIFRGFKQFQRRQIRIGNTEIK